MENKLNEQKEQWCKFYCKYRQNESVYLCEGCKTKECEPCEDTAMIIPCNYCQVTDFIKFIRDDL